MDWEHIVIHSLRMKKDCHEIQLIITISSNPLSNSSYKLRLNLLSLFANLFPMLKCVRVLILVYSILGLTLLLTTFWFSSLKVLLGIICCTKAKEPQEKAYRIR
jgi:hypothetical protein